MSVLVRSRERGSATACIVLGLYYSLIGLWMLLAPHSFANFVGYGAFNRHFIGDIGVFCLAFGIALLRAARDPYASRFVIDAALLASVLHLGNHLAEGFWRAAEWQTDVFLACVATLSLYAAWSARR